jgi:hypothetical protein
MPNPLKSAARWAVDRCLVPLGCYVSQRIPSTNVLHELERRTAEECADYAQLRMANALQFVDKSDLLAFALGKATLPGIVAEFGVWKGKSINRLAQKVHPALVYGFDSFEGLKEDWAGWDMVKGSFDLKGGMPSVATNVRLLKGWFDATIPPFLAAVPGSFAFAHVDSDTYEAAKAVLDLTRERLRPGTVLVFDEYFGYRGWRLGEFRAWQECASANGIAYDYLGFSTQSVAVRVTSVST